jgi:hypothetical protein
LLKALPRKSIPIVDELTISLRDLSNNGGIISEFAITRLVTIMFTAIPLEKTGINWRKWY